MYRFMRKGVVLFLISGACLLQTAACTDQLLTTTAISSAVTAGGVLYIVGRILND